MITLFKDPFFSAFDKVLDELTLILPQQKMVIRSYYQYRDFLRMTLKYH